jgi:hypothetical protein
MESFRNAVRTFSKEGSLPPFWEKLFYRFNKNRDEKNRSISGGQESYTLLGTGLSYFARLKEKKKIDSPEDEE